MSEGLLRRALSLLYPCRCAGCDRLIPHGQALCPACADAFERLRLPEPPADDEAPLALFEYEGAVRQAVILLKFHGRAQNAAFLGGLLAGELERSGRFELCCGVPMTAAERRRRDYNHAALLAKSAAKALDCRYAPRLLVKRRETGLQHRLSREERSRNLRDAFSASPEARGRRILLIDDVLTTGATLRECAQTLYRAGAREVRCAALARVRRRRNPASSNPPGKNPPGSGESH